MSKRVLFLLASARTGGNAELLARTAAAGLPASAESRWLRLADLPLPVFEDHRHDGGSFTPPEGVARTLLDATLWATDLVLAAPTYWYSLPAAAKLYLDHWTAWLRLPGLDFKERMAGRRLWVITVNADEPGDAGDSSRPLLDALALTAAYLRMTLAGAVVGHANRPGEVSADHAAMAAARALFETPGITPDRAG